MTTIKSILNLALFTALMILVVDIGGALYTKQYYKGGLDLCTKAASMEIVRDDDYAKGIIKIDRSESKEEFKEMMKKQFNLTDLQVEEGTIYAEPVNEIPSSFTHPESGKEYMITEPMFIAVFKVKRNGIFIKEDIVVDNLSSSRVTIIPR